MSGKRFQEIEFRNLHQLKYHFYNGCRHFMEFFMDFHTVFLSNNDTLTSMWIPHIISYNDADLKVSFSSCSLEISIFFSRLNLKNDVG